MLAIARAGPNVCVCVGRAPPARRCAPADASGRVCGPHCLRARSGRPFGGPAHSASPPPEAGENIIAHSWRRASLISRPPPQLPPWHPLLWLLRRSETQLDFLMPAREPRAIRLALWAAIARLLASFPRAPDGWPLWWPSARPAALCAAKWAERIPRSSQSERGRPVRRASQPASLPASQPSSENESGNPQVGPPPPRSSGAHFAAPDKANQLCSLCNSI